MSPLWLNAIWQLGDNVSAERSFFPVLQIILAIRCTPSVMIATCRFPLILTARQNFSYKHQSSASLSRIVLIIAPPTMVFNLLSDLWNHWAEFYESGTSQSPAGPASPPPPGGAKTLIRYNNSRPQFLPIIPGFHLLATKSGCADWTVVEQQKPKMPPQMHIQRELERPVLEGAAERC